jgi:hypothetical protein
MRHVTFFVLLSCLSAIGAELSPPTFREWLDDGNIEAEREVTVSVSVAFDGVQALFGEIQKADPKAKLETYDFRPGTLTLSTTKAGLLAVDGRLDQFGVSALRAQSDLGTLSQSMSKISKIRNEFEAGKLPAEDASEKIRSVLLAEFNLRHELTKNDIIALGAAFLDKEFEEILPEYLVGKVRHGYVTGLRFNNELQVRDGDTPPADTTDHIYVELNSFPTFDGHVTIYRKVAIMADAVDYVLGAMLPKGYRYDRIPSSPVSSPKFVLSKI